MELWIARDSDGYLYLYDKKPILKDDFYEEDINNGSKMGVLILSSLFPEVTFENSPKKVELKLVEE